MAETNHTDTSDDEFAGHEFLTGRKAALLGARLVLERIQIIQCVPLLSGAKTDGAEVLTEIASLRSQ
jgi:hypothetical protein